MAITLGFLIVMLMTPVSANALTEDAVSLETLLHDPLFMLIVLVGFVALGGAFVMIGVISYRRVKASESAFGSQMGYEGQLDFTGIKTPVELQALSFGDGFGEGFGEGLGEGLGDELGDGFDNSFDMPEIEEPMEHPSMEFTDDMIQQVIAEIGWRREVDQVNQEDQVNQVDQVDQVDREGQEEQGRGRQAEIEWLVAAQKRPGRHFKPAHVRTTSGDETNAESMGEPVARAPKHSREQEEMLYQRVG
jgi:hypothetical protein